MILHANNFGCVPDGRFLERASVTAGSTVLAAPDGILRPMVAGKKIIIRSATTICVFPTKEL